MVNNATGHKCEGQKLFSRKNIKALPGNDSENRSNEKTTLIHSFIVHSFIYLTLIRKNICRKL